MCCCAFTPTRIRSDCMASAAPVGAVRCNARPHHSSLNHPRSLLYYLTKDWSVSDGGLFVDMEVRRLPASVPLCATAVGEAVSLTLAIGTTVALSAASLRPRSTHASPHCCAERHGVHPDLQHGADISCASCAPSHTGHRRQVAECDLVTVVCHSMCTTLSHCDALRPPSGLDCNVSAADNSAMQMGVRQST